MNLHQTTDLFAGGPGSGCNPSAGKCGRPSSSGLISVSGRLKIEPIAEKELWRVAKEWKSGGGQSEPAKAAVRLALLMTEHPSNSTYVARDVKYGVVGLLQVSGLHHSTSVPWVEYLATHPGIIDKSIPIKGIGTRLMLQAAKIAADKGTGLKLVALEDKNYQASPFYEKLGMHRKSTDQNIYSWSPKEVKDFATYGEIHAMDADEVRRRIQDAIAEEEKTPALACRKDKSMKMSSAVELRARAGALPGVARPAGGGEGGEHSVGKYITKSGRKAGYLKYPGKVPVKKPKQSGIKKYLSDGPMDAGGPGSGCQGENCGRPAEGQKLGQSLTRRTQPSELAFGLKLKRDVAQTPFPIDNMTWNWSKDGSHLHIEQTDEDEKTSAMGFTMKTVFDIPKDQIVYWGPFKETPWAERVGIRSSALQKYGKKMKSAGAGGTSGWQYGYKPVGYIQQRTLSGFPNIGRKSVFGPTGRAAPGMRKPNPSAGLGKGLSYRPNQTIRGKKAKIKAELGEPPASGAFGGGHIEPVTWFKPPSLRNPKRVPTDDPKEKDNQFFDVQKRNSEDTKKLRMKRLKRSAPGGNPPLIPVRTTAVQQHTAVYQPDSLYSAEEKRKMLISRPARMNAAEDKRMRVSYNRRGCI